MAFAGGASADFLGKSFFFFSVFLTLAGRQ